MVVLLVHVHVSSWCASPTLIQAATFVPPTPRDTSRLSQVTSRQQRDSNMAGDVVHGVPAGGVPYVSGQAVDNSSAYSGAGGGNHVVPSPSHSQANSMASSFRNIPQVFLVVCEV